tara:strand:- start:1067 stop:1690 length:624 start_codon:yes stop_codon:yes gene_type:complete
MIKVILQPDNDATSVLFRPPYFNEMDRRRDVAYIDPSMLSLQDQLLWAKNFILTNKSNGFFLSRGVSTGLAIVSKFNSIKIEELYNLHTLAESLTSLMEKGERTNDHLVLTSLIENLRQSDYEQMAINAVLKELEKLKERAKREFTLFDGTNFDNDVYMGIEKDADVTKLEWALYNLNVNKIENRSNIYLSGEFIAAMTVKGVSVRF